MLSSAFFLLLVSKTGAETAPTPQERFAGFSQTMGRAYLSAEEAAKRFEIFTENLEHILKMRMTDGGWAEYSEMTPFADWSIEEFNARNNLIVPKFYQDDMMRADFYNTSDLPDSIDWVEKGAVNAVKDQGSCGSCWAFSTVSNIESMNFVKTGKMVSLSEQELIDCDKNFPNATDGNHGCKGGFPYNAMGRLAKEQIGLEPEGKYPYTGKDGHACAAQKSDEIVFIASYLVIKPDENQMAAALVQHGPLSIGLNGVSMMFYKGGIADPWSIVCQPFLINHAVNLVGYGVGKRLGSTKKYWKIRNSWGPKWGEEGYYRIVRGENKCGLNSLVSTAVMTADTSVGNSAVIV